MTRHPEMQNVPVFMREDLEPRIRSRGLRVEERLALLATLLTEPGEPTGPLDRREQLLEAVRAAARKVREALP